MLNFLKKHSAGVKVLFLCFGFLIIFIQGAWASNIQNGGSFSQQKLQGYQQNLRRHLLGPIFKSNSAPRSLIHLQAEETTTTTTTTTTKPPVANRCPSLDAIYPCTCSSSTIECDGSRITQGAVFKLINALREVNGVATDDLLFTDKSFRLWSTTMTSFDLTPLLNTQFISIDIRFSHNLSRIYGPLSRLTGKIDTGTTRNNNSLLGAHPTNSSAYAEYFASIHTPKLTISRNKLSDDGLADCFHYFAPSMLVLDLGDNLIQGPPSGSPNEYQEFLPGIWTLVNLQSLNLLENQITHLSNAPFKALGSLTRLTIGCVEKVGENAFLMDDGANAPSAGREIQLFDEAGCSLNDTTFPANHGLQLFSVPTTLELMYNKFEFLSQEKFEPFLLANVNNKLDCAGNRFVCDQRMKWLKDGREYYRNRVWGVDCVNDPGYTIFTTNLV